MENGTNFFIGHSSSCSGSSHNSVQNGSGSSSLKWGNYDSTNALFPTAAVESANSFTHTEGNSSLHAITFPYYNNNNGNFHHYYSAVKQENWSPFAGDGSHVHPDPNLMCLKLGKRHYFKDPYSGPGAAASEVGLSSNIIVKRGKPNSYCGIQRGGGIAGPSSFPSSAATGPRCQVDGCHMVLVNAKEYHRRHKVCEMHSKAPRVTVLGLEQRFCQQCSRFHAVSEFDEAKRSCRRRLAGHNERRRKNSHESVISRIHFYDKFVAETGRWPYLLTSTTTGRALSLLSSESDSSWVSPSDISLRSSAALRELIAEHRASILARQLFLGPNSHYHPTNVDLGEPQPAAGANPFPPHQHQTLAAVSSLDRFHDPGTHVTLDLMRASSSAFGFLSTGRKNKEEEEECSLLWNSWEGTNDI